MDSIINNSLSNETFHIFLTLVLAMLGGNTIRPVPRVLREIFESYFLFKYLILVLIGCRIFYPVNKKKLLTIIVSAFLLLYLLEILRKYD
jgi:hypothetical protein